MTFGSAEIEENKMARQIAETLKDRILEGWKSPELSPSCSYGRSQQCIAILAMIAADWRRFSPMEAVTLHVHPFSYNSKQSKIVSRFRCTLDLPQDVSEEQ